MLISTTYDKHLLKDLIRHFHINLAVLLKAIQTYGSHFDSRFQQTLIWHFCFWLILLISVYIAFLWKTKKHKYVK